MCVQNQIELFIITKNEGNFNLGANLQKNPVLCNLGANLQKKTLFYVQGGIK